MNKVKIALALLMLLCTATFAQQKGTFTDTRDKKTYKTVTIGERTWMAENLNYADKGSKCYGDKPANCTKYGRLYDLFEPSTSGYLCPDGWLIPSGEWWTLITAAGGAEVAGKALKAKSGWNNHAGKSGNGTDNLGFAALPGGSFSNGKFIKAGEIGLWWVQNRMEPSPEGFTNSSDGVLYASGDFASIRCVKATPEEAARMAEARAAAAAYEKALADSIAKAKVDSIAKVKADSIAKVKAKAEMEARIKANSGTFTDSRDKRAYKTIKIGNQTWMAENLDYADKDSKCYDNKPENCKKYGRLYNWAAAIKVCPADWHLPTQAEWTTLINAVGGVDVAGRALKSTSVWQSDNYGASTDEYGFAALPGGNYPYNSFSGAGTFGDWWSSTEYNVNRAHDFLLGYGSPRIEAKDQEKYVFYSVRCLQGKGEPVKVTQPAAQPAQQPAQQPAAKQQPQQPTTENCSITFPKKACVAVPKGSCGMMNGKVVAKCP